MNKKKKIIQKRYKKWILCKFYKMKKPTKKKNKFSAKIIITKLRELENVNNKFKERKKEVKK